MKVRDLITALSYANVDFNVYVAGTDVEVERLEINTGGHFVELVPTVPLSEDPTRAAMQLALFQVEYAQRLETLQTMAAALKDAVGSLEIIAARLVRRTTEPS